jgi:hypothetical protein
VLKYGAFQQMTFENSHLPSGLSCSLFHIERAWFMNLIVIDDRQIVDG